MSHFKIPMVSVAAFNDTLLQFLTELSSVFPEETKIKKFARSLETLASVNARKSIEIFLECMEPHRAQLAAKDGSMFDGLDLGGIDLGRLWAADIDDDTRESIWGYLSALMMLATTVSAVPTGLLGSIEAMASDCAGMTDADGELDINAVMSTVMSRMGELNFSDVDPAALATLAQSIPGLNELGLGGAGADMNPMAMLSMLASDPKNADLEALLSDKPSGRAPALPPRKKAKTDKAKTDKAKATSGKSKSASTSSKKQKK